MSVLVSNNVTWGISGPEFLAGYGLLTLVSLVGVVVVRWWLAAGSAGASAVQPREQPRDIAYLNGGPQLAVLSALSSMRVAGTILLERSGRVHAGQAPGEGADELERAIHLTAIEPIAWQQLVTHRIVRTALESVRQRLEGAGLLLSAQRRRRIKLVGLWMVAVAALGLARAGAANSAPVGYLILELLVAVGIVSALLLCTAPTRSRRGTARLKNLRATHTELAPEMRPDWTAYGPALAGLGVGIFGASALWASDPDLAAGVGVRPHSASRYSGAGCGGAGYYGGGGCSSAGHSGGFFDGHSGGGGCGGGHGGGGCGGGHGGGCGGGGHG